MVAGNGLVKCCCLWYWLLECNDGLGMNGFLLLLDVGGLGMVDFMCCLVGAGGVGRSGDLHVGCG